MLSQGPLRVDGLFAAPVSFPGLLDSIPLGVAVVDAGGRVVFINRFLEGLTGFECKDVISIPCAYVLRSNICIEGCPVRSRRPISEPLVVEGDIINRERQKIPVRITFAPIVDLDGKAVGTLEAVQDIRMLSRLNGKSGPPFGFGQIIGRSPQMERIYEVLPVIAQSDSSVLLTGETGSGKDFVAELIHQASPRAKDPFIKVNCGALPETLLESELFGHQKGAFTGAIENKPGRFRLAHNGTLYLTEIGDLPLSLQVKLLTCFDDRVVFPLGSTKGFHVDVRVIAATHRNLEQMVREGRFREDLLFRLNVVRLRLPPLRERGDDVQLLLNRFLQDYAAKLKKPIKGFSAKALRILLDYSYPGNVRELRNIVEYGLTICQEDQIQPQHLPAYLTDPKAREPEVAAAESAEPTVTLVHRASGDDGMDWSALERKMILEAMLKAKGRRGKAAAILGWGRSTLWRKMKQYGIDE